MKRIGILGFGIVGKSVIRFIKTYESEVSQRLFGFATQLTLNVWDKKNLTEQEYDLLAEYHAQHMSHVDVQLFVQMHDFIVASPGFDINTYADQSHKFLNELDFFAPFFSKPTIGITGTLGKTSTTKLLTNMLNRVTVNDYALRFVEGGNVGTAMLDLIGRQHDVDGAVLELSSWQLEHNKSFAPDMAIWTNVYPNHLDRHKTMAAYAQAKYQLMGLQRASQHAIIGDQVLSDHDARPLLASLKSRPCVVTEMARESVMPQLLWSACDVVDLHHDQVRFSRVENQQVVEEIMLLDAALLPPSQFVQNWLFVLAALKLLGVDWSVLKKELAVGTVKGVEHRLEWCAAVGGVDFYNDSKSTVIQSTQAAVQKLALSGRPLLVIVGGLGKGADRSALATMLREMPAIKKAYCFGPSCFEFASCAQFATLDHLLEQVFIDMSVGDIVLFSPSGSSYDLFENYEHRGRVFKDLVQRKANAVH
ncbi:UDP-N-acetylmuramoyl-L-alanine--D-glutamate ligase [bacterium]|nr:MAG: UDP-N-acetylmuramoyl-L-alanine--D-glutamate ligase [bacterium]